MSPPWQYLEELGKGLPNDASKEVSDVEGVTVVCTYYIWHGFRMVPSNPGLLATRKEARIILLSGGQRRL